MFNINCEMTLREFDQTVGFWSGARDRWIDMTEEEIDYLEESICDYEFTSITQVNDFVWFESDEILEEFHAEDEEDEEDEE